MSTKVGPLSEHGAATYNAGCRCERCRGSNRNRGRRLRAAARAGRDRQEGDWQCIFCGCWFRPHGLARHERVCEG